MRNGAQAKRNARSPLAESARLRPASRLRHGARRLARGADLEAVARPVVASRADVPGRMVDSVAPHRGRLAGRSATGAGRTVVGRVAGRRPFGGQGAWLGVAAWRTRRGRTV